MFEQQKAAVQQVINERTFSSPLSRASAFAPVNIALCKYWGKRDPILNLPVTSSLSLSLGKHGTKTDISMIDGPKDEILLNDQPVANDSQFYKRLVDYLNIIRQDNQHVYRISTYNNVATAAGLASSASGFAALVKALDKLYKWQLDERSLSILARLGSGSACRSIYDGFVFWQRGEAPDGSDSYALPVDEKWSDLCMAIINVSKKEKAISSRQAMADTVKSSPLYKYWPERVNEDIETVREAIRQKDFRLFGETVENNALTMHATMMTAIPPIIYWLPDSIACIHKVHKLRQEAAIAVYLTMDAGPNVKLLFLEQDESHIKEAFPNAQLCQPFKH